MGWDLTVHGLTVHGPLGYVQTCLTWTSLYRDPQVPPHPQHPNLFNIFKPVHYEARWQTGGSQPTGLLSCYIWLVVYQHLRVIICVVTGATVWLAESTAWHLSHTAQLSEFCGSGSLSYPTVRDTYRMMSALHIIIVEKYEGPAMTDQASNKLMQNAKRTDIDR